MTTALLLALIIGGALVVGLGLAMGITEAAWLGLIVGVVGIGMIAAGVVLAVKQENHEASACKDRGGAYFDLRGEDDLCIDPAVLR